MNETRKSEIIEKINEIFVNDFKLIKNSQQLVNEYLILLEIIVSYDYNSFCVDFLNKSKNILDNISDDVYNKTSVEKIIANILSKMIEEKIMGSDLDNNKKSMAIMKLELDKYLSNKK